LGEGEKAWEMGLRVSWVDLTSKNVQGGEQWNAGAAINYYRRENLRFMFNLLRYRTDHVVGDQDGWIFQARVQYNR
jgi:phosphate-selective porin